MRRFAPNILLFVLLLFLVLIYRSRPTTEVLALAIILLAMAVFLAYTNRSRGLEMLAFMTAFVSILGMFLLGQVLGGVNVGYCFVVLWLLVIAFAARMLRRRAVLVERGQLLVVNQLPNNRIVVLEEGLHGPLTPLLERKLAALPAYELVLDTAFEHVNTQSPANIDQIRVLVRYGVDKPPDVVNNFPNREQAQTQLVRERGEPPADTTSEQVAFWTELIQRQMRIEVDQSVRSVLAAVADLSKLQRARHEIEHQIDEQLHKSVSRWGMTVIEVRVLEVNIDPAYQHLLDPEAQNTHTGDTRPHPSVPAASQTPTTRFPDDQPQLDQTERVVREVIERMKAQGTEPNPDQIEQIVRQVMQEQRSTPPDRSSADDTLSGLSN